MLEYNAYELANMADVASPDSSESQGALFLLDILSDVNEFTADALQGADLGDEAHTIADEAVYRLESRGTYRKWAAFCDLAAWQEDPSDLGYESFSDLNEGADVCLFMIADRLAMTLLEELAAEESDDDEDDDAEESEG